MNSYTNYYMYKRLPRLLYARENASTVHSEKILLLNFLRSRFFPTVYDLHGRTQYLYLSMGMVSWRFKQSKAFRKHKTVYLLLANFLRKILLYSSLTSLILVVKKIPIYFREILNTLLSPTIAPYQHPFFKYQTIEEKFFKNPFSFSYVIFTNNKPYGKLKLRKRGRLKRKISKKVVSLNRIPD